MDGLERGRPAIDADAVALAERLEPLVVTDRVSLVLGLVADEVHPRTGALEAREATIVIARGERLWMGAVPELAAYPCLLRLSNPWIASLSARNVGDEGYETLLKTMRAAAAL